MTTSLFLIKSKKHQMIATILMSAILIVTLITLAFPFQVAYATISCAGWNDTGLCCEGSLWDKDLQKRACYNCNDDGSGCVFDHWEFRCPFFSLC